MPNWLPHLFGRCRRLGSPALLKVLALSALVTLACSSGVAQSASTYQVPATIASDCSVDVTQPMLSWMGSLPDNSVISFASGACYRIEGTLELQNRSGLTLDGNGAIFRSFNPPTSHRSIWRLVDSWSIVIRNMTLKGSYAKGGVHDPNLQWAHGIDLPGTSAEVANVAISDVAGDCVAFGEGWYGTTKRWASGSFHDSTCTRIGRNAVSVTAANDVRVERVTATVIGLIGFDVEPSLASQGANRVVFNNNTIASYYLYAYAVIGNGPTTEQAFTNNRIVGEGLRLAVLYPDYRPQHVTISGNSSDTPAAWPMEFHGVDGLTVTSNVAPTSSTPMATGDGLCSVNISGNTYPGGTVQAGITPWLCALTPTSGSVGTAVKIAGSGFTGATAVAFNGTRASFTLDSDSQITATVPVAASSGPLTVTAPGSTAISPTSFNVTWAPTATSTISTTTPTTTTSTTTTSTTTTTTTPTTTTSTTTTLTTPTTPANPLPPLASTLPSISGPTNVGKSLSASAGSWTGSPTMYSYAWFRCDSSGAHCGPITEATASIYLITLADLAATLRVAVIATNAAGSTSATSLPTKVVKSPGTK